MGITLDQLVNTVGKMKDYTDNKSPNIDPIDSNSIEITEEGLFSENKQPQIDYIKVKLNPIARYQKYINTELDYIYCRINENQTNITDNVSPNLTLIEHHNIEINGNNNGIILKAEKTYNVSVNVMVNGNPSKFKIVDVNDNNKELGFISASVNGVSGNTSFTYTPVKDGEIRLIPYEVEVGSLYAGIGYSYIIAHEINRNIIIDPVEYINTTQGIEDTPVGSIISHLGTTAPEHYLICDGGEYNIVDYPYLVQHIEDNFGVTNYFGGDGIFTFRVPNLNEKYLKGSETSGIYEEAGLPNITADWKSEPSASPNGAVYITSEKGTLDAVSGGGSSDSRVHFDASLINPIYGKSETVTPSNISVLFCIKFEPTYYAVVKRETTQEDIALLEEKVELLVRENTLLQHEINSLEVIIEAINRRQAEKEEEENGDENL